MRTIIAWRTPCATVHTSMSSEKVDLMTKKKTPGIAAKRGTLEDFLTSVAENPGIDWKRFLPWALSNQDVAARVEIANWMLDHGADPARVNSHEGTNALHVMFGKREHDYIGEAKLLQRFLDGGADINLKAPKWNLPIYAIIENYGLSDKELGPFYDVIFSYPGIDWDIIVGKAFGKPVTLKEYVDLDAKQHPDLHRRMHDYLQHGPSPRPEFN